MAATSAGGKILSSAEIENLSAQAKNISTAVDQAVEYSSNIIDGTVGSQLMKSYEQSSAKNAKNVEDLNNIVTYLKEYNKIVNGMLTETQKHLTNQRNIIEGNVK